MEKIDQLQKDLEAQAKTITELVQSDLRRQDREKADQEMLELKEHYLAEEAKRTAARIDALYSLGRWILAAAGSAVVLALTNFILNGGLRG